MFQTGISQLFEFDAIALVWKVTNLWVYEVWKSCDWVYGDQLERCFEASSYQFYVAWIYSNSCGMYGWFKSSCCIIEAQWWFIKWVCKVIPWCIITLVLLDHSTIFNCHELVILFIPMFDDWRVMMVVKYYYVVEIFARRWSFSSWCCTCSLFHFGKSLLYTNIGYYLHEWCSFSTPLLMQSMVFVHSWLLLPVK